MMIRAISSFKTNYNTSNEVPFGITGIFKRNIDPAALAKKLGRPDMSTLEIGDFVHDGTYWFIKEEDGTISRITEGMRNILLNAREHPEPKAVDSF